MIEEESETTTGSVLLKFVLKNFTKFTGKHLCPNLFFNKVVDLFSINVTKPQIPPDLVTFTEERTSTILKK